MYSLYPDLFSKPDGMFLSYDLHAKHFLGTNSLTMQIVSKTQIKDEI